MGKIFASFLAAFVFAAAPGSADQDNPRLDTLFAELQATKDLDQAKLIQRAIWQVWLEAKTDKGDRLMALGIEEMHLGDLPQALHHFNYLVEQAPELAEGWNKRATILFMMGDYAGSVRDIQKTLALEPRHWGALSGLGQINMRLERVDEAIQAFEEAVAINPHLLGTKERIKQLKEFSKGKPT
jgi:tetratricopeptide (TPR) repeat protein